MVFEKPPNIADCTWMRPTTKLPNLRKLSDICEPGRTQAQTAISIASEYAQRVMWLTSAGLHPPGELGRSTPESVVNSKGLGSE